MSGSTFASAKKPAIAAATRPSVQRKEAHGAHAISGVPTSVHDVLQSSGQPLDTAARAYMEPRFGDDFSRMPIHPPAAGVIQTKLAINQPGDEYEQEADRVAEQVLAAPAHAAVSGAPLRIQRYAGPATKGMETAPASVDHVLANTGRPLDSALQQDMGQRFGHDFSQVRVHTGGAAEQSAREVNANAYTVGQEIVFGAGQYALDTTRGRQVLAHELTHVVQQGGGLAGGKGAARLQRQSISDFLGGAASEILGPPAGQVVGWYAKEVIDEQFIEDLIASVKEAKEHEKEIYGEAWEAIKNDWAKILSVTIAFIIAQAVAGTLIAAGQVIGLILEIAIIAIGALLLAPVLVAAYQEGENWILTAKDAKGDPTKITQASRSYVRMVLNIVMAVLAAVGSRIKIPAPQFLKTGATKFGEMITKNAREFAVAARLGPTLEATMRGFTESSVVTPIGAKGAPGVGQTSSRVIRTADATPPVITTPLVESAPLTPTTAPEVTPPTTRAAKVTSAPVRTATSMPPAPPVGTGAANTATTSHRQQALDVVSDAVAAGLVDQQGNPLSVDAAVQLHQRAPDLRAAFGQTGAQRQSAHMGATSLLKTIQGYSRALALTENIDPQTHRSFDNHWMRWIANRRRAIRAFGSSDYTAPLSDVLEAQRQAIRQTLDLTARQKGTLEWLIEMEIHRLARGLPDGMATRVPLPAVYGS